MSTSFVFYSPKAVAHRRAGHPPVNITSGEPLNDGAYGLTLAMDRVYRNCAPIAGREGRKSSIGMADSTRSRSSARRGTKWKRRITSSLR
jgi:hypothetical protein